jgi:DNA-cytosine methyltransferase
MNVLSLFDGMSCGRIALERLGIKVDNYYASEIDKYAMKVSEANYPDIKQIGDVLEWQSWDIDWSSIDLVTGGFPCQSWSLAGKQLGDKDERGKLFWVMLDIMKKVIENNPNAYYLMENVKMKKQFEEYITFHTEEALPNVNKYLINSALVSAQNRVRYYWTNIPGVEQPKQKGMVLRDILENKEIDGLSEKAIAYMNRGSEKYTGKKTRAEHYIKHESEKSKTLTANMHKGVPYGVIAVDKTKLVDDLTDIPEKSQTIKAQYYKCSRANFENDRRKGGTFGATGIPQKPIQVGEAVDINGHDILKRVYSEDGKSPTLNACTGGNREPKVMVDKRKPNQINPSKKASGKQPYMQDRVFHVDGKSHALTREFASRTNVGDEQEVYWRKLTPVECERLQTVPDNYTNHVSNTQRYKMLGNGWTIEVICHILKNMAQR